MPAKSHQAASRFLPLIGLVSAQSDPAIYVPSGYAACDNTEIKRNRDKERGRQSSKTRFIEISGFLFSNKGHVRLTISSSASVITIV